MGADVAIEFNMIKSTYDIGNYEGLAFSRAELAAEMRRAYDDIIDFVSTPAFIRVHDELMALPATSRISFVAKALFSAEGLKRNGIEVPAGILIQNSAFGDRRPTLFVVKKMMPEKYQLVWENMNLSFFNEFREQDVSTSDENAWRAPLPVKLQNELLTSGASLESVPAEAGVKLDIYETRVSAMPSEGKVK